MRGPSRAGQPANTTVGSASHMGPLAPMCGRVRLPSDMSRINLVFPIAPERPMPNIEPSPRGVYLAAAARGLATPILLVLGSFGAAVPVACGKY